MSPVIHKDCSDKPETNWNWDKLNHTYCVILANRPAPLNINQRSESAAENNSKRMQRIFLLSEEGSTRLL